MVAMGMCPSVFAECFPKQALCAAAGKIGSTRARFYSGDATPQRLRRIDLRVLLIGTARIVSEYRQADRRASAMAMGLRQQLMAAAVARHLAVDLLQIHGDKAGEALKEMLRESSHDAAQCEILRRAGDVLKTLHPARGPSH